MRRWVQREGCSRQCMLHSSAKQTGDTRALNRLEGGPPRRIFGVAVQGRRACRASTSKLALM